MKVFIAIQKDAYFGFHYLIVVSLFQEVDCRQIVDELFLHCSQISAVFLFCFIGYYMEIACFVTLHDSE